MGSHPTPRGPCCVSAALAGRYEPALIGLALLYLPVLVSACWLEPPRSSSPGSHSRAAAR